MRKPLMIIPIYVVSMALPGELLIQKGQRV
jgi:hypothetical protein